MATHESMTEQFLLCMRRVERYQQSFQQLESMWELIECIAEMQCPAEAGTILPTMTATRQGFKELEVRLVENLVIEELKKVVLELTSKAQVVVDILVRNLYERTADVGFLATDADIVRFLAQSPSTVPEDAKPVQRIVRRLEEYRDKYTVYDEIIILNCEGCVCAHLDRNSNISHSQDPLIAKTLAATGYVETFGYSDLRPGQKRSLIYSRRIENPKNGNLLGVLCLCFRFENEMLGVFHNLKRENDKSLMLLVDRQGQVLSSSDENHIQSGQIVELVLHEEFKLIEFGGREYLAKTCATKGYQGYQGLGWYGHAMIPVETAFREASYSTLEKIDSLIVSGVMSHSDTFCPALRDVVQRAEYINLALRRVVWNGQVMAASNQGDLSKLKVVLRQISKTGQKTSALFANSTRNLYETVISSTLDDVQFMSKLAIDIMDRNLYERANDCRWWALASDLRHIMAQERINPEDIAKITSILQYINSLYTVYRRLFVYDLNGVIVAASNLHEDGVEMVGCRLEEKFVYQTFDLKTTQQYCVSPFQAFEFYGGRPTYIYNAAIRDPDKPKRVVGGIGILFDAEPEFEAMLRDAIPSKPGVTGIFTDREGCIIASTDSQQHPVGDRLQLPSEFFHLTHGEGLSSLLVYQKHYYAVGCTTSFGYREYKNTNDYTNDVIAFVLVPFGEEQFVTNVDVSIQEARTETPSGVLGQAVELATFFVGEERYALPAACIEEAVSCEAMTALPGAQSYLAGMLSYRQSAIPVIRLRSVFGLPEKLLDAHHQVVVVQLRQGLVGLLVDDLDVVLEVDHGSVQDIPPLFHADSGYVCSVVRGQGKSEGKLLNVLDIDRLVQTARARLPQTHHLPALTAPIT